MALIAYLMEHKNVYGPHLIIVPNAVSCRRILLQSALFWHALRPWYTSLT